MAAMMNEGIITDTLAAIIEAKLLFLTLSVLTILLAHSKGTTKTCSERYKRSADAVHPAPMPPRATANRVPGEDDPLERLVVNKTSDAWP
mmetsp:Transcript_20557/g.39761  ORF Transcript_20557/g.39761 Transcript_20557/m.39761 type:complete len:90 (-) Transcript_20557:1503-1772(-)